ncbi:extracellular solute-binding protein (plasmid) [Deinococcus sp. VB343]|uniref:Extracellular solute-binding protein n=1 Tax=Deinococcus sp. VB142 TaxID=3112952 RepID=A0AAU6Q8D5_9DEIO
MSYQKRRLLSLVLVSLGCGLLPEASAQGGKLVIYSNSLSDGRGDWLTAEAKKAGFDIQLVDLGGADVTNRLIAERNNPIADVVFGLNNVYFEKLKAANVLEKYKPNWASKVNASSADKDGQFWPIVKEPIMLVYNKAAYPNGKGAPTDWSDLWTKPQYKGKYEVATSLGGATTQMVLSGILSRYRDPKGDLGISDAGWKAIEAYYANGKPSIKGKDLYARMKAGEINAGQMWLAGKASREKTYGVASQAAQPKIGVPMVFQHVAIIRNSKNEAQAKKFMDWFGSGAVQAQWSQKFFTAPTNKDALAKANVTAVRMTNGFKAQKIDWGFVASNLDKWIEKIELQYLK